MRRGREFGEILEVGFSERVTYQFTLGRRSDTGAGRSGADRSAEEVVVRRNFGSWFFGEGNLSVHLSSEVGYRRRSERSRLQCGVGGWSRSEEQAREEKCRKYVFGAGEPNGHYCNSMWR